MLRRTLLLLGLSVLLAQSALAQASPKSAYQEFLEKLAFAGSFAEVQPLLSQRMIATLKKSAGDEEKMLSLLRRLAPSNPQVAEGTTKGNQASISVTSANANRGTVQMVAEDGVWKVDSESWAVQSDSQPMSAMAAPPSKGNAWLDETYKMAFPRNIAFGVLNKKPFRVERAELERSFVKLMQGKDADAPNYFGLTIFFDWGDMDKNTGKVGTYPIMRAGSISEAWNDGAVLKTMRHEKKDYAIKLQFGAESKGYRPGYIIVRFPDKSYVEGYFYAKVY